MLGSTIGSIASRLLICFESEGHGASQSAVHDPSEGSVVGEEP